MSSLLLLFLLCLSMHGCHARLLSVIHEESSRQVHPSGMDVEKTELDKSSVPLKVKSSITEEIQTRRTRESLIKESKSARNTRKPKDLVVEETEGKISGVVQVDSLGSVSWRVPHEKHEGHPRFDLDYSLPKAHPPSHN